MKVASGVYVIHHEGIAHRQPTQGTGALMRIPWLRVFLVITAVSLPAFSPVRAQEAKAEAPAVAPPSHLPFELSKETTLVTKPVRKDGTIDYVAVINERLEQGVTRENNAAIGLLEAIARGGVVQQERHYATLREKLGMPRAAKPAPAAAGADKADDFAGAPAQLDATLAQAWVAKDFPETAKWLESKKARLDVLVEASKRDRYFMPLIRPRDEDFMISVLLPHLNEARQAANELRSRAMLSLGNEDAEGFRRDAVALVRLGRLMTAAATAVEKLVAMRIEAMGLEAIKIAVTGGWLSEAQAQAILEDVRAAPAVRPMYELFELPERAFILEFLQFAGVHGALVAEKLFQKMTGAGRANAMAVPTVDAVGKDWNAALKKVNRWYDRMVDAGRKPTHDERERASAEISSDLADLQAQYTGIKRAIAPLEDRAIMMLMSSLSRLYQNETQMAAYRRLIETALALSAFRTASGDYPEELKQLTPAFFKEEPVDPFTEKPLVYRKEGQGYVLRSVAPIGAGRRDRADELIVKVAK